MGHARREKVICLLVFIRSAGKYDVVGVAELLAWRVGGGTADVSGTVESHAVHAEQQTTAGCGHYSRSLLRVSGHFALHRVLPVPSFMPRCIV